MQHPGLAGFQAGEPYSLMGTGCSVEYSTAVPTFSIFSPGSHRRRAAGPAAAPAPTNLNVVSVGVLSSKTPPDQQQPQPSGLGRA